ncbi:MAG: hypothetical protein JNJ58_14255 [Chitinophagaceae bacterium]|nr:hypothetical protein [Chitinophagaceae bacterium]
MNFKKLWISCSIITVSILTLGLVSYSCGWGPDECDSYTSFMSPALVTAKNMTPYAYAPFSKFFECEDNSENKSYASLEERNIEEWQGMINGGVAKQSISDFVYHYTYEHLKNLYDRIEKNKSNSLPDSMLANEMTIWFLKAKNLEALGYLMFAKQCEPIATAAQNEWDQPVLDSLLINRLIRNGKQLYQAAKQPEIKSRYAFQVVRMAFYGKKYSRALKLYDSLAAPIHINQSSVSDRLVSLKAGCLYRTGRKDEAAYLFSKLFDQAKDYNFHHANFIGYDWCTHDQEVEKVIRRCTNDHEKAVVYGMRALRNTQSLHQEDLNHIFQLEPTNDLLDVILIREINKHEAAYADYKFQVEKGYRIFDQYWSELDYKPGKEEVEAWYALQHESMKQIKSFCLFLETSAGSGKLKNPALWYMAAAYLHLLHEDHNEADRLLTLAKQSNPNGRTANQIRIIALIRDFFSQKKMSVQFEDQHLTELIWFEKLAEKDAFYQKSYRDFTRSILPHVYIQSHDTLSTLFSYVKYEDQSAYYNDEGVMVKGVQIGKSFSDNVWRLSGKMMDLRLNVAQLQRLKQLNHESLRPYTKWLMGANSYTDPLIDEIIAVKYLRKFQFDEAHKGLKKSGLSAQNIPNPFVAHIRDFQDAYPEDDQQSISLIDLADSLHRLQNESEGNVNSKFKLACALYSLSYHGRCGKAWWFHRESSSMEPYMKLPNQQYSFFESQYYFAESAYQLFQEVYKSSNEGAVKQQALWMMAKCAQKRCPEKLPYYSFAEAGRGDVYSRWASENNPWFTEFYKTYKNSDYYREVYQECSYLRNFAEKQ